METIKIAIAGQANTGKTTLISTFIKSKAGKVEDRAGATPEAVRLDFKSLPVTFIDTPGFENAGAISLYLNSIQKGVDMGSLYPNFKKEHERDFLALEAINDSDIVIYVVSLEQVPNTAHDQEISLIQNINSKVIAVLNQYHVIREGKGKEVVENRINQWEATLKRHSIDNVITFDAHWDKPSQVNLIYDIILSRLDSHQKTGFERGLEKLKIQQKAIRKLSCSYLGDAIVSCREAAKINVNKMEINNQEKKQKVIQEIYKEVEISWECFIVQTEKIYEILIETPDISEEQLDNKLSQTTKANWFERLSRGSAGAGVMGPLGGLMSALIALGISAGSGGAIPAAIVALQVGAGLGSVVGSLLMFSDKGDIIMMEMSIEELEHRLITGVAMIWGLSNIGYGSGKPLAEEQSKKIAKEICDAIKSSSSRLDLARANKDTIIGYAQRILNNLENPSNWIVKSSV
ncbi:GTPase [Laspinema olomoucense]|uniref:GTPase n=1 Tax=Laspinema olomoucense TaxID=3231600 RepID=UPI0021BBA11B|nr:GTPase [Laspinema sp. D3a]MCT7990344.1 50S ribosome-binding GTPase [Laspinema sp. D3a]